MPRKYKKRPGSKVYQNYDKNVFKTALRQYKSGQISLRDAHEIFNIPKSTLQRHATKDVKKPGGQPILRAEEETRLVELITMMGEWGYPLEKIDIRYIVKGYLDRKGIKVAKFDNNLPGYDWVNLFYSRHQQTLTVRLCENIKRSRASITPEIVNNFFDNLAEVLQNVQPQSIINYDETCFVDDPGRKHVVVKRRTRHPERIIDSTKSSTSVMFSISASGEMLPPFVVYKSEHIYDTWVQNGPKGARYGRNKSGWFDQALFEDWFTTIALRFLKMQPAPRVIIGDNLCSHLSYRVVELCEENDIRFCLLPPNSTHLTQPLDVAVFGPLKKSWRKVLQEWKKKYKGSLPKQYFPGLLNSAICRLDTMRTNIIKSFAATGIHPLDRTQVTKRLPQSKQGLEGDNPQAWTASVEEFLSETRNICKPTVTKKKKIAVEPGKSVVTSAFSTSQARPSSSTAMEDFVDFDDQEPVITVTEDEEEEVGEVAQENLSIGEFIEVKFETNKDAKFFVGQIQNLDAIEVKFLRPNRKRKNCFIFPAIEDMSVITLSQIMRKLPIPTKLRRGGYEFPAHLKLKAYLI